MCCAHIQRWPSKSSAPVVPVTIRLVLRLGQDGGSRSLGPIEVLVDVVHVHEQTIDDVRHAGPPRRGELPECPTRMVPLPRLGGQCPCALEGPGTDGLEPLRLS